MADFRLEAALRDRGYPRVAGVDEAGRGPLAGPVVVAAVMLPGSWPAEVPLDDSKRMSPQAREAAYRHLRKIATWGMAVVQAADIDRLNILQATLAGMRLAVGRMRPQPDYVLVDGPHLPALPMPGEAVVKGDQRSLSIAAASVLAKVVRDRIMRVYGARYPQWGFEVHKGYGTAKHREAMRLFGPSPIHRASFKVASLKIRDR